MALTVNSESRSNGMPSAPLRLVVLDVSLDSSYPATAGGYPVPELDDVQVVEGLVGHVSDGTTALLLKVHADGTLHAYVHNTGVEVVNGVDLVAYANVKVPVLVE